MSSPGATVYTGSWSNPPGPRADDRPTIVTQIDLLQRIAKDAKKDLLGADWFRSVKDFFSLDAAQGTGPLVFRPRVDIPELQMQMLSETAELTDSAPVIYLTGGDDGKRDEKRERIFRGIWKQEWYSLSIMLAQLWANFGGTGILAAGIDPFAYNGRGSAWLDAIDPEDFDPDPTSLDDNWEYVVYTRPMTLDAVRRRWPDTGWRVPSKPSTRNPAGGSGAPHLSMPFGPMTSLGGQPPSRGLPASGLVNVRFCYTLDPTPEKVKDAAGSNAASQFLSASKFKLRFPNGRLTIDGDGYILYDGDNPTPHRKFPFIPYWGLPKLEGFWAPPPIRYTRTLQEFAERSLTQAFENAYRCNNGIWLLPDGSGLDADKFGGLPGEIQVVNMTHGEPKFVSPNAFPASYLEYIKFALEKQASIQGYGSSRSGQPGAGNLSVELYESAIEESSKLTRLRARLSARSTQKAAELVFYLLAKFFGERRGLRFSSIDEGTLQTDEWQPITDYSSWNVLVDPGSLEVMSQKNLRKTALALSQAGKIDTKTLLTALGWPGAEEIADKADAEAAMRLLSTIKKGRTVK
jgi:hypothetical protein